MTAAPQTNGIFAGDVYLSQGTTGSLTYNSVVYPNGTYFTGVDGVNDYTATGDFGAYPEVSLGGVWLGAELAPNQKTYPNQELSLGGVFMEFLSANSIFNITEYTNLYNFYRSYGVGAMNSPVTTNGGTISGVRTDSNFVGSKMHLHKIKAGNVSGKTIVADVQGTPSRFVIWSSSIGDAGVLGYKDLKVEIISESTTSLRIRIITRTIDKIDIEAIQGATILYAEYNTPVNPAGSTISRTITATFTVSSVIRVSGYLNSESFNIYFKLLI